MSFGFSVSDILSITQLAWKTIQNSRKACGEHDDFTREVSSLHLVLQRLQQEIGKSESPLNKPSDSARKELQSIVEGCEGVLKKVNTILKKHDALRDKENSSSKLWQKFRFGNGQVQELAQLRTKISYYVSDLTLFLNMVSTGTMGRVEKKMDDAGGDLTEIRIAVNGITAHLMSKNQHEGSVFTTYADDDKAVWREFRRELNQEGFSSSVIHDHKKIIKAYIKELASRGVLDEIDGPSNTGSERMPMVSESEELSEDSTKAEANFASAPGPRPCSDKGYDSPQSIAVSRLPKSKRAETTERAKTNLSKPGSRDVGVWLKSQHILDSSESDSSPLSTLPRSSWKGMSRAETNPKGSKSKSPVVESRPQKAFVQPGSSNIEVDEGHKVEVNSGGTRNSSADDDNNLESRHHSSKDGPSQGNVRSVKSEDIYKGLRFLSEGYDGRNFETPPTSGSTPRCRSCYSWVWGEEFVTPDCSHHWCYECLEALVIAYPGGDGVPNTPGSLARQRDRRIRWDLWTSNLSISKWQAIRLECCAAGSLDLSQIKKVLGIEVVALEPECEEKKERPTSERLQFCREQNCRAWTSPKDYMYGGLCRGHSYDKVLPLKHTSRERLELCEKLEKHETPSIEPASRIPTRVHLHQLSLGEEKPRLGIHDAIRAYRLGFLPAWKTFISDPPLSALAKAEYCNGLVEALTHILQFVSLQVVRGSYRRGLLNDLVANAQMMLARVMEFEKSDECINYLGQRRLINDNSAMEFAASLWKGPILREYARWCYISDEGSVVHRA